MCTRAPLLELTLLGKLNQIEPNFHKRLGNIRKTTAARLALLSVVLLPPLQVIGGAGIRILDFLALLAFPISTILVITRLKVTTEYILVSLYCASCLITTITFAADNAASWNGLLGVLKTLLAFYLGTLCWSLSSETITRTSFQLVSVIILLSLAQFMGGSIGSLLLTLYPNSDSHLFFETSNPTTIFGLNTYNLVGLLVLATVVMYRHRDSILTIAVFVGVVTLLAVIGNVITYGLAVVMFWAGFFVLRLDLKTFVYSLSVGVFIIIANEIPVESDYPKLVALRLLISNPEVIVHLLDLFPGLAIRLQNTFPMAIHLITESPWFGNGFGVAHDSFWLVSLASTGLIGSSLLLFALVRASLRSIELGEKSVGIHFTIVILLISSLTQLPFLGGMSAQLLWFLIGWQSLQSSSIRGSLVFDHRNTSLVKL